MHRDPNLGAFFVTEKLLIKGIEKVLLRNSYSDQGKVRDRSVSWLIEKTSSLLIKQREGTLSRENQMVSGTKIKGS